MTSQFIPYYLLPNPANHFSWEYILSLQLYSPNPHFAFSVHFPSQVGSLLCVAAADGEGKKRCRLSTAVCLHRWCLYQCRHSREVFLTTTTTFFLFYFRTYQFCSKSQVNNSISLLLKIQPFSFKIKPHIWNWVHFGLFTPIIPNHALMWSGLTSLWAAQVKRFHFSALVWSEYERNSINIIMKTLTVLNFLFAAWEIPCFA